MIGMRSRGCSTTFILFSILLLLCQPSVVQALNVQTYGDYIGAGNSFQNQGEYEKALDAFNAAIQLNPDLVDGWSGKLFALNSLGRFEETVQVSGDALKHVKGDEHFWTDVGWALDELKRYDEADQAYQKALSFNPNFYWAWNNLAAADADAGKFNEGLGPVEKAISIDPANPYGWQNKANILYQLGRYPEALEAINRSLSLDPGWLQAQSTQLAIMKAIQNSTAPVTQQPAIPTTSILQESPKSSGESPSNTALVFFMIIGCMGVAAGATSIWARSRRRKSLSAGKVQNDILSGRTDEKPDTGSPGGISRLKPQSHHDVFISYSEEDKPIADAVCSRLEARSMRCWIAPRDVLPGREYPEAIIDAIDESRIMVLIFSSSSNTSPHVIRELTRAVGNGAVIIPFRIEDIQPSKSMAYLINLPHWLDALTPPLEKHIEKLAETVQFLLEQE